MLTKEDYRKIIEIALTEKGFIGKNKDYTGDVASIPSRVKGAFNKFNKSIRNLDHETCLIVNNNGDTIYHQDDGTANHLQLDFDATDEKYRGMELHLTHNHPQEDDDSYGNICTFLSPGDIRNISSYEYFGMEENGDFVSEFKFKSITAEGSNGSRMTMTMVDEEKFRKKAFDKDMDTLPFRKAIQKYNQTCDEWLTKVKEEVSEYMEEWMDNRVADAQSKGEELHLQDFIDECEVEKRRYQKEYSTNHMREFFREDYKRFESMGLEISLGWLK